jgi:uncharacterized membrane protein (UPF0127 family)
MQVKIGGEIYSTEVMSSPEDTQNGMKGRKNLDGCMLFKLKKGYHSFYMKDCLIPLDIIFVSNNKITSIHLNCEPCQDECKHYHGFGDYVIEFMSNENRKLNIGDIVQFLN